MAENNENNKDSQKGQVTPKKKYLMLVAFHLELDIANQWS
jgi:hypothetical protein